MRRGTTPHIVLISEEEYLQLQKRGIKRRAPPYQHSDSESDSERNASTSQTASIENGGSKNKETPGPLNVKMEETDPSCSRILQATSESMEIDVADSEEQKVAAAVGQTDITEEEINKKKSGKSLSHAQRSK